MAPWQEKIVSLITSERERWISYVRRLIDDAAERDGEDIVQDVIVNLFDKADITSPIENLTAYVYRALRNRIIDYLRKKRESVSLDGRWLDEEALGLYDVLPDPQAGDIDETSRLEIRQNLFKASRPIRQMARPLPWRRRGPLEQAEQKLENLSTVLAGGRKGSL